MSSIHEVAKLLGVSTTAIRKYEEKGLLTFARNAENDYREFDAMTVGMLVRIRQLRQEGFSLDEINEMIKRMGVAEIREKYEQRQAELEKEIREREQLKAALDIWKEDIDCIGKGYVWKEVPTYYCVKYMDYRREGVSWGPVSALAQRYLNQMPTCFTGLYISGDEVRHADREGYNSEVGIFLPESELQEEVPGEAYCIPGGRCISFCHKQADELGPAIFAGAVKEIQKGGYRLRGEMFGRIFVTTPADEEGRYITWVRYFIPVEKIDEKFTKGS